MEYGLIPPRTKVQKPAKTRSIAEAEVEGFDPDQFLEENEVRVEGFDPDKFLADNEVKVEGFDPDQFLAENEAPAPKGELGFSERTALGFLSGPAEKQRYLAKKFPGAKFGTYRDQHETDYPTITMPGEKVPKYYDDPSLTPTDVADFVGDIPGMIGGAAGGLAGGGVASIPAAGAGAAAGEVARKAIGRKFVLGEDVYQPEQLGEDLFDVGFSGALGSGGQAIGVGGKALLARRAGKQAAEKLAKEGAEEIAKPAAQGIVKEGTELVTQDMAPSAMDQAVANTKPPGSLKEMIATHQANVARGAVPDLPTAERLREIVTELPDLKIKPTPVHEEMLKSKQNYDILRTRLRDLPGPEREAMDAYDQGMKSEIKGKIGEMMTEGVDKTQSGAQLIDDVLTKYKGQKAQTGPLFKELQEVPIDPMAHVSNLTQRISEAAPGLAEAMTVNEKTGKMILRPFRPDMGISRKAYNEFNQVLRSLNEGKLDFKQMQRIREYLRKTIDPSKPGETADLQSIRSAMLSHMEDLVETQNPDLNVRQVFKAWAKNEKMLDDFEVMLGGKLESFEQLAKANPEGVLGNIFANTNRVKLTRDMLGKERFNALTRDYLATLRDIATDNAKNDLSMARFASELKRRKPVLVEALGKEGFRRLENLADLGKIIPDMPPVNPSATGKTSLIGKALRGTQKVTQAFTGTIAGVGDAQAAASALDQRAAGKAAKEYFDTLLKNQPVKDKGALARKLLPYVQSKTARVFLQGLAQQGRSLRGPREEGLINGQIQGPEGQ